MTDKPWIEQGDPRDPEIAKTIRRNERIARHYITDCFRKNRKQPEEKQIEGLANVIGIMAADLVSFVGSIDPEVAQALGNIIRHHVDNAESRIGTSGREH